MAAPDLDRFTAAYADTALTDSVDDDGDILRVHGLESLAPETVRQMRVDCAEFRLQAGEIADEFDAPDIDVAFEVRDVALHFWRERNRRQPGFLDGDYPGPAAFRLSRIAQRFAPSELYLDDGLIRSRRTGTR